MQDREVLQIGAWAAIVGGVLAILVNLFSPRPGPEGLGDPTGLLDVAGASGVWEPIQVGVLVALLALLAAFYAITTSIEDRPARGWARLGLGAALVGTTLGVAAFGVTAGFREAVARVGADAVVAAEVVSGGLFNAWVIVYLGFAAVLYGLAFSTSDRYPAWLGWAAILAGVVGLTSGLMDVFAGATAASTFVLFPISSGLLTLVVLYAGVLLLRLVSAAD